MGVRRGWLSLLKPSIQDWNDVLRAFDRLLKFVDNLRDQINFVRRGIPGNEAEEVFKNLRAKIEENKHRAEHWMNVDLDPVGYGRGTFTKADGEHMLGLYKTQFKELLTTYIKSRATPADPYRKTREANLTELFDKLLGILREDANRLEEAIRIEKETSRESLTEKSWKEPAFKEFHFGNMKVIVVDPKAKGRLIQSYIKELDKAYQLTNRKGFKELWYGVLFMESGSYKELSSQEIESYKTRGYHTLRSVAGTYKSGKDVVAITRPPEGLSETLIHELGHRYWYKFMKSSQRARFEDLIRVNIPGKIRMVKPIEPELIKKLEKELYDKFIKIGNAIKEFHSDKRWFTKAITEADEKLYLAVSDFVKQIRDVGTELRGVTDVPRVNPDVKRKEELLERNIEACQEMTRSFWIMGQEINALPEGTDFQKVFHEKRDKWIQEMQARAMEAEGNTYQFIADVNKAHEQVIEEVKRETEPHIDPKDPRSIMPVSEYGKSNIEEAFAEAFEFYVTGKDMTRGQIESFRSVLASSLTQKVVSRFLYAGN
jgi:hypothetical protein